MRKWLPARVPAHYIVCASTCLFGPVLLSQQDQDWDETIARGRALYQQGSYADALVAYRHADALVTALAPDDPKRVHTWNCLCSIHSELGHTEEAEKFCVRALSRGNQPEGDRLNAFNSLHLLIVVSLQSGQVARGRRLLERLDRLSETIPSMTQRLRGTLFYDHGFINFIEGRFGEAESNFSKARDAFGNNPKEANLQSAAVSNLAAVYLRQRRYPEAEFSAREAIAILDSHFGPGHPESASDLNTLANVYLATGRAREAEPLLQHGISLAEAGFGPNDIVVRNLLDTYASVLKRLGRKPQAQAAKRRAEEITARLASQLPGRYLVDGQSLPPRK